MKILKEIEDDNSWNFILKHLDKTNRHHRGTPRDAFMGSPFHKYNWDTKPITISPDDPRIDLPNLYPASKRDVKRYMVAYKKGSKFPPILITIKNNKIIILDGAHRLQAAINLNVPIDAYVGTLKNKR